MATTADIAAEDMKRYRDAARRRAEARTLAPADNAERDDLLKRVRRAAAFLKTHYRAKRVILFGSLAHEAWYMVDSDVDLAVEGLPDDTIWEAWRTVEEIIGDRSVDLIEIETAGESLRHAIERHGVSL